MRVDFTDLATALATVRAAAKANEPLGVHFVNAFTMSLASSDDGYATTLKRGDLNLPDGRPVVWAARWAGLSEAEQVCGPDFLPEAFAESDGLRHYLYGSSETTLSRLEAELRRRYPAAVIAGSESPPFRPLTGSEEIQVVERVRSSNANVMWVGLGTPKQDVFVEQMKERIGIPLVAVGAAFDFVAGTKSRPPAWVSRMGLEWVHRFVHEPRRLGKRYLVGNARFIGGVVRGGVRIEPSSSRFL